MSTEDKFTPEYVDDLECPYFVHRLTDQPKRNTIGKRLQATLDHPNGGPTVPAIWDARDADLSAITLDSNLQYSQQRPHSSVARRNARTCIVVSKQRDYATMRQLMAMLGFDSSTTNIVFDYEEAIEWLKEG